MLIAPPITARCARCGGQAYVEVALRFSKALPGITADWHDGVDQAVGDRLEFCGHHYEKYELTLVTVAIKIIDHRPYLRSIEGNKTKEAPTKVDRR